MERPLSAHDLESPVHLVRGAAATLHVLAGGPSQDVPADAVNFVAHALHGLADEMDATIAAIIAAKSAPDREGADHGA